MVLEHLLDLVEEDACLGLGGLLDLLSLPLPLSAEEDFALGEDSSQATSESGDTGTGPEEGTPRGFWNEVQVDDCGDEVTCSVPLL